MLILKHKLVELIAQKQQQAGRILTIAEIAKGAGLSRQTLYTWLNDGVKRIDADTVTKLCTYFECDIPDLLYLEHVAD